MTNPNSQNIADVVRIPMAYLLPGEETILAIAAAYTTANRDGEAVFTVPRAWLEALGAPEVITFGAGSGAVSIRQPLDPNDNPQPEFDAEPLFDLPSPAPTAPPTVPLFAIPAGLTLRPPGSGSQDAASSDCFPTTLAVVPSSGSLRLPMPPVVASSCSVCFPTTTAEAAVPSSGSLFIPTTPIVVLSPEMLVLPVVA